jgi:hypothetical protein
LRPIFRHIDQALFFAYMIQAYDTPLQTFIGVQSAAERAGIDFGNLTRAEVRAECAKVRDKVRLFCCTLHAHAIEAKYEPGSPVRMRAIRAMADYLECQINAERALIRTLTLRHYTPDDQRDEDFSLRAIGKTYVISKDKAQRLAAKVAELIEQQETGALRALTEHFEQAGLIGRPSRTKETA